MAIYLIPGDKFGAWEVVESAGSHVSPSGQKKRQYLCRCNKCGNTSLVMGVELAKGSSRSCGCVSWPSRKRLYISAGDKFNQFTVQEELPVRRKPSGQAVRYFRCLCDCGTEKMVSLGNLTGGAVKSCGCTKKEKISKANTTHGASHTKQHNNWKNMIRRCEDIRCKEYKWYGARGIKVCDRWKTFELYREDVGEKPSPLHSMDRIDNDGDYEPLNIRWATKEQQANNTRKSTFYTLEYNGELLKKSMVDWCLISGVDRATVMYRLNNGWDMERAFFVPAQGTEKTGSQPATSK